MIDTVKYMKDNQIECYSYHPEKNLITKEVVEELNKEKILTFVWTVNDEDDFKFLEQINVSGVITNYPDKFKKLTE